MRSLLHDGKGILYIGTERGLFIYKGGSLNQIMIDPNMLSAANSIGGLNLGEGWNTLDGYGEWFFILCDFQIEK